jgi:glycosyltransferase involved in cell wall biosynthesis
VAWLHRPRGKDKLLILDPVLKGYNGHHAEFANLLKAILEARFDVGIYCSLTARTPLIIRLKAQPIFWDTYGRDVGNFDSAYAERTRLLVDSLKRIDPRDLDHTTIAVMHTTTIFQLGALAEWFGGLPKARRPRIFLQFQFPPEFGLETDTNWRDVQRLIHDAAAALATSGTVRFAANSQPLAERWAEQLDQRCALMPIPVRWPDDTEIHVRPEPLTFGFFGGLRPEKGAWLIAEAVPAFLVRHPDARFIVHAPTEESDVSAAQILQRIPQVKVIRTSFNTKAAYFRQFLKAGCILLPYDPRAYAVRTSGVLLEALGLGRLIITTKGTWMEGAIRDRSASSIAMTDYSADGLLESLDKAYRVLLQRTRAPTLDAETMRANSPTAFCEALVRLMQS